MKWREYHEATKHSVESLRRMRQVLDWANMPDPFRHYEGVPVLDLPADPPVPEMSALDVLRGTLGTTPVGDGPTLLSQLLFYSAAISASKRVPSTGYPYALRVNPSSGNLHPTEFHFLTRGLKEWPDGLYHYDSSRHMAEQRGLGNFEIELAIGSAPIVFVLTSIVWREAWKYGERAYRYCLHDIGHAWQALALSARAIGCHSSAVGYFPDDDVARRLQLNDDEWPMLIVRLHGKSIPVREADTGKTVWFGGQTNQLSKETIAHPLIDSIHFATKQGSGGSIGISLAESALTGSGGSSCLLRRHRLAALARLPACDARRSTSWVESNRCHWRSSRPSSTSQPSHCRLILQAHASSSFTCMLIASMGYNPASTGSWRSVPSWSRSRVETSAWRPLV